MENIKSLFEAIISFAAVVGIVYSLYRFARPYVAAKVSFALDHCAADADSLSVRYVVKNESRRAVFVESLGLYDPDAVVSAKEVTCLKVSKALEDGTPFVFSASVRATEEDLAFLYRLRPYAVDKRRKVHLGPTIDPHEIRAAFKARHDALVALAESLFG